MIPQSWCLCLGDVYYVFMIKVNVDPKSFSGENKVDLPLCAPTRVVPNVSEMRRQGWDAVVPLGLPHSPPLGTCFRAVGARLSFGVPSSLPKAKEQSRKLCYLAPDYNAPGGLIRVPHEEKRQRCLRLAPIGLSRVKLV